MFRYLVVSKIRDFFLKRLSGKRHSWSYSFPEITTKETTKDNKNYTKNYNDTRIVIRHGPSLIFLGIVGYFIQRHYNKKTLKSYLNINIPPPKENLFERKDKIEQLTEVFQMENDHYYLVVGPHGCGKSTLVKLAARNFEKGVIYVQGSDNIKTFGDNFARAINYPNLSISEFFEGSFWRKVLSRFEKFALKVNKSHSFLPVLIIDNVSKIDPEVVKILQDVAKTAVDNHSFTTVFVANDLNHFMRDAPHCNTLPIEDLSKDETLKYLVETRKTDERIAKRIYDFVGGRTSHFIGVVEELAKFLDNCNKQKKNINFDDETFRKEAIKVVDDKINAIKVSYLGKWESIPVKLKPIILQFMRNNMNKGHNNLKSDFVKLFNEEEKGEHIFSLLLEYNIISYTENCRIEIGAPIIKVMFDELYKEEKKK